jgi:bacterioferritin (cytochrome b1)
MTADSTISVLNRLLVIHYRSLARYLSYASPTWHRGDDRARAVLHSISNDHQATVERLGELIIELGGIPDYGSFPIAFTGYHDLSFDFLLKRLIEHQRRNLASVEQCVDRLALNPLAKAVAEEALGAAKGHLESLLELQNPAPELAVH